MDVHLYLDVDGVLNAVAAQTPDWGWPDERLEQVCGYPIRWSPSLVDRLNRLAARPDVAAHWVTTWVEDAAGPLSSALGIDGHDWPVLGGGGHYADRDPGTWWKLDAVRAHLPEGTRAVWVDDDLPRDAEAMAWVRERGVLGIGPATTVGLTPDDLARIEAYVDRAG